MTSKAWAAVTPVVLTYNEEPNIGRCLDALRWAKRVVVVDSGSTDATGAIVERYPNAVLLHRPFDDFKQQTDFGIAHADTEYVLPLDADMMVSPALLDEIDGPFLGGGYAGGLLRFDYRIVGRSLLGSLYPAQYRIFRRSAGTVIQVGHGHTFAVEGLAYTFEARLCHDDRKSVDRWASSQIGYSRSEHARMAGAPPRSLKDRLRRLGLMPLAGGAVAYVRAGGPLRGRAALCYAYERVVFECLLAMRLFGEGSDRSG
jgi:glycosyltransferase involved in cell wall biosynthesis